MTTAGRAARVRRSVRVLASQVEMAVAAVHSGGVGPIGARHGHLWSRHRTLSGPLAEWVAPSGWPRPSPPSSENGRTAPFFIFCALSAVFTSPSYNAHKCR